MKERLIVVIVEDKTDFINAIEKVLKERGTYAMDIKVINPRKIEPAPTFEDLHDRIADACGPNGLVLLDDRLGEWEWHGAIFVPLIPFVISISSKPQAWARHSFEKKAVFHSFHELSSGFDRYKLAFRELNDLIDEVLALKFGPDFRDYFLLKSEKVVLKVETA